MELVCQAENEDNVYSIIEKYEYECLDSLKCGTQLFSTQTEESTSHPTRASPGRTGREAGKEHGNKEVWSRERKGGGYRVTKHSLQEGGGGGLHGVTASPGM